MAHKQVWGAPGELCLHQLQKVTGGSLDAVGRVESPSHLRRRHDSFGPPSPSSMACNSKVSCIMMWLRGSSHLITAPLEAFSTTWAGPKPSDSAMEAGRNSSRCLEGTEKTPLTCRLWMLPHLQACGRMSASFACEVPVLSATARTTQPQVALIKGLRHSLQRKTWAGVTPRTEKPMHDKCSLLVSIFRAW